MSTLPNPWLPSSTGVVMPSVETAAAFSPSPQASDAAATPFDGPDIPMTVLMARGFDVETFLAEIEPLPLFLQAPVDVLNLLAGY